jgi:glycosyltransferase involved in cell wall biosynthesis
VVAQCEEPDGLACALAVRAGGPWPPLVVQVHDLRYKFGSGTVRFVRKSSLGFIFKKSARVVANSDQTVLWLQREYNVPADKIGLCRIHLTQPFLQRAAPGAGRAVEERILFLGALNRKKGPDIFLRAAILLARERPEATFVLAGAETAEDSSFRATLGRLAANPLLAGRLESLGKLEPGAVIEQIGRARLVVCPSRIETFSRATVEALALGRPVIVSATTGAAHWVTSTGTGAVVPPDDPKSLAEAIRAWIARVDGPDAGAEIRAELTASRAADDWIREVKRALTSPRSPA